MHHAYDQYQFARHTLANGIQVYANLTLPINATLVAAAFHTGSLDDPEGKSGLAHFMEHMPFRGTIEFPDKNSLTVPIEDEGGMLNAWTSTEKIVFLVKTFPDDLRLGIRALKEMTHHALLRAEDLELERGVIVEEWKRHFNAPAAYAIKKCRERIFSGHPLQRLPIGDLAAIRSFTIEDVRNFYNRMRHESRCTLIVIGSGDIRAVLGELEGVFGNLPGVSASYQPERHMEPHTATNIFVDDQPYPATHMVMGSRGISGECVREVTAANLLIEMAGSGFSSPLFQELREKRGLVYNYGFNHLEHSTSGMFYLSASTSLQKTNDVCSVFLDTLEKVSCDEERLESVKRRTEKALAMENLQLTNILLGAVDDIVEGGHAPFSLNEIVARVRDISLNEIRAVAEAYLQPAHFTTVIVKSQNE